MSHRELTEPELFTAAVRTVFSRWTAFKLAIENQGGQQGQEIAKWIMEVTEKCIYENSDTDGWELGEWIAELLNNEFDTFVEDGSLEEVGNELVQYWRMWNKKEFEKLAEVLDKLAAETKAIESVTSMCKADAADSSSDESEEEAMDTECSEDTKPGSSTTPNSSQQPGPSHGHQPRNSEPDADGWVTVQSRKK